MLSFLFLKHRFLTISLIIPGLLIVLTGFPVLSIAKNVEKIKNNKPIISKSSPDSRKWAKGRLLVVPRAGVSVQSLDKVEGIKSRRKLGKLNAHVYELPEGVDEVKFMEKLRKDRRFKAVELDRLLEPEQIITDPAFGKSWALPKIAAPAAWDIATGDGITIAILDTGVDDSHPDLAANMVPGWNMHDNNADSSDIHGHGTKVAGTAASAANNGQGSAGVAWNARIMPIRIARPDGMAYLSTMAQAIRWAADNGAQVANLSYGGADSLTVQSAANYMRSKGGIVVMSAGNSGTLLDSPPSDALIVVSATGSNDVRASWSTYGPLVDVAAPGVSIYTTTRGGGYGNVSGTSFSSPITAATVALMLSANPDLTPTDVDGLLKSTAIDLGEPGVDQYYGHGRIDAARAVEAAHVRISVDNIAPVVGIASPTGGQVSGSVPVDVSYSDNKAVVRIELHVNGQLAITDTEAPFAFMLDTTELNDDEYTITAHAFDAAGNQGRSTPVTITVKNSSASDDPVADPVLPEITQFNLTDGMKVKRYHTVLANASDTAERMTLSINGDIVAAQAGAALSYRWRSWDSAPRGTWFTVTVEASDAEGNTASRTVNVRN
ncbi:MAG: S8 family serine peptidase [Nitrosomonas sp.]|nr:S8 family serine peptidase [Nitrosomonas sp.]